MTGAGWGIVATVKAPDRAILGFAAYHLDLGAREVHIYLDTDAPKARRALVGHPACRVIVCDEAYWTRRFCGKGRPDKHQQRQSANATHCYRRRAGVAWLAHIDVDEFLICDIPLSDQLAALGEDTLSARVRPVEALAPDPDDPPPAGHVYLKAAARLSRERAAQTQEIYPTYGAHLNGGYLSHVAGKVFVRTGQPGVSLRIHNAFRDGAMDDRPEDLPMARLAHLHAPDWDSFVAAYRFRLARGSYRSELKPATGEVGLNMHALFAMLESEGGERALRAFFDEVCTATPALRARLARHGLLHEIALDPDTAIARHFPEFVAK